jgi:tetratricopeptide (TPR) repeat protein
MGRWAEAESDCSSSLSLSPNAVKPLYRRALARVELGKFDAALEDVEGALQQQPDNKDLQELREKTRKKLQRPTKSEPPKVIETSSSPVTSPTPSPSSQRSPTKGMGPSARAAASIKAAPPPKVPEQSPKNSVEMLRNFHSMQKHPAVLATYVRERIPPSLVQKMFMRCPIEPDDLATLLGAIQSNLQDGQFQPDRIAEYLQCLLKTHTADIQFGMLSDSEKEILRMLLSSLPADSGLHKPFRKILC